MQMPFQSIYDSSVGGKNVRRAAVKGGRTNEEGGSGRRETGEYE